MESRLDFNSAALNLPAQRVDAAGGGPVDGRAVLALALPLIANSAVQIVLNLTDVWFIGHISMQALAAVGAVQWLVAVVVLLLGGVRMDRAVGNPVRGAAFSGGGRRRTRDSRPVWIQRADRRAGERILAAAGGRGNRGHGAVGDAQLLQRHRPLTRDRAYYRRHGACQRAAECDFHLYAGLGSCRVRTGNDGGPGHRPC